LEQVKAFAIKVLIKFVDDELTPETVEIATISAKTKEFLLLDADARKVVLAAGIKDVAKEKAKETKETKETKEK
jgi:hypothetical protein